MIASKTDAGFRLYYPYASHELTVRDLLTHRSGLGKGQVDLLIFPQTSYSRQEIVDRLRFLKTKASFRSVFAYDNVLYIVAGALLERVSGLAWEEYVCKYNFAPLEMVDASPSFGAIITGNRAWPHARTSGLVRGLGPLVALPEVPSMDNEASAGSINANAQDMSKWLALPLHEGAPPGTKGRIFSSSQAPKMCPPSRAAGPAAAVRTCQGTTQLRCLCIRLGGE